MCLNYWTFRKNPREPVPASVVEKRAENVKQLSRLRSRLHELTLSDLDVSDYDTLSICDRSLPFSEPDSQCHHCGAMSTLTRDSTRACDPIRISESSNPGPPRMSESSVIDQVRISESSNTDVPRKPVRTKSMQRGDRPQGISSTTSMPQMDQSQRLQDLQNELIQVKWWKILLRVDASQNKNG